LDVCQFNAPIATFDSNGHYSGEHAAIFLGYGNVTNAAGANVAGFYMLDQYYQQPPPLNPASQVAEVRFHVFDDASTTYHLIIAGPHLA
jgi:hypothetical protein